MTTQILYVTSNTQSAIEQKADSGIVDMIGVCFGEILQSESEADEKEQKDVDVNCLLNLMSAVYTIAPDTTENPACEAEDANCSTIPEFKELDVAESKEIKKQVEPSGILKNVFVAKQDQNIEINTQKVSNEKECSTELLFPTNKEASVSGQEQNDDKGFKIEKSQHQINEEIAPGQEQKHDRSLENRVIRYPKDEKPLSEDIKVRKNVPQEKKPENNIPKEDDAVTEDVARNDMGDVKVLLKKTQYNSLQDKQKPLDEAMSNKDIKINNMPVIDVLDLKSNQLNKIDTFENSRQLMETVKDKIIKSVTFTENDSIQEFQLQLKPEFLGKLEIRLLKSHDGMKVKIFTSSPEVREMLTTRSDIMQAQIHDKGIDLSNVEIIYNSLLGDKNMQGREKFEQQSKRKIPKAKGEYRESIVIDVNGNSITNDININGTVNYLV